MALLNCYIENCIIMRHYNEACHNEVEQELIRRLMGYLGN